MMHRVTRAAMVVAAALASACSDATTAVPTQTTEPPASTNTITCASPLTLSAGQIVSGVSGTSLCVGGLASSAEYALIPFNASTASATTSFDVVAAGTSTPTALPTLIASNVPSFSRLSSGDALSAPTDASAAFEAALRRRERAALPSRIGGARTWVRSRAGRASLDLIPATAEVGQYLKLNANADVACGQPSYRTGRVVAVTNKAIVVADTGNPSGGYTDAEYTALGTTFDTLVDPLDREAFGDPSDIDHNGRVVLFFTKTVNDLTPTTSSSYIGGFFYARDLFPATASAGADACSSSNVGEMFYIMVPDPSRGGPFLKANVAGEVYGTLAHEYQHLINASRRMYVNTAATDFEETWLDEGLAHIAEELLFYRASGLQPRQNLTAAAIRQSAATVSAFNNYESANFARYREYLANPTAYSPYADNDSLATRGATWAFLRYAADHLAASDGNVWSRLVNSTSTGFANLQSVFGAGTIGELRDWGTSVLADDVNGVSASYEQPSWNFRSMFAALSNSTVFPVANVSLTTGSHAVSLTGGANAYLRFVVPAGAAATLQWSLAPSTVQFTLVRMQ